MTNLLYVTVWGRGLVIPSLALTDDKPAVCDCLGQRSGHPLSGPDPLSG